MTMFITPVIRKGEVFEVITDSEIPFKMHLSANGYPIFNSSGGTKYLHHHIIGGAVKGKEIDHINGNKLDCRAKNLRYSTSSQNKANKLSKGYYFHKRAGKWQAYITFDKKKIYLGLYETEEEAHEVYKRKHAELYKEFSPHEE